jgi:hypothetical protein
MFFQLDFLSPSWDRTFLFTTGGEVLRLQGQKAKIKTGRPHHNTIELHNRVLIEYRLHFVALNYFKTNSLLLNRIGRYCPTR